MSIEPEISNDEVICPGCAHQFRAIPVNIQKDLRSLKQQVEGLSDYAAEVQNLNEELNELNKRLVSCLTAYVFTPTMETHEWLAVEAQARDLVDR